MCMYICIYVTILVNVTHMLSCRSYTSEFGAAVLSNCRGSTCGSVAKCDPPDAWLLDNMDCFFSSAIDDYHEDVHRSVQLLFTCVYTYAYIGTAMVVMFNWHVPQPSPALLLITATEWWLCFTSVLHNINILEFPNRVVMRGGWLGWGCGMVGDVHLLLGRLGCMVGMVGVVGGYTH